MPSGSAAAERIARRLRALAGRLESQRLQLAVLGQFKRGKSTLLNALLGADILPMAVTPLTAIPTFMAFGESAQLRVTDLAGSVADVPVADIEALRSEVRARVTENGNPRNRLGLARVDATLSSELLRKGIVLLDTPGIGSTYEHNTRTAEAILPECDTALFVVSPDPPITAAEVEYLARIRATAPRVVLVLNKIDLVEGEDRKAAVEFLRGIAEQTAYLRDAPLFAVSARGALRARMAGNAEELAASGIEALERYLDEFICREKAQALEAAVARKFKALICELQFDVESRLAALRMPVEQLSERIGRFEQATRRFEAERLASSDLIAGDSKRLLGEADAEAERLRVRTVSVLEDAIDRAIEAGEAESAILRDLANRVPSLLDAESRAYDSWICKRFAETFRAHQQRADTLIAEVRRTAADLLDICYASPAAEEMFALKRIPYWTSRPRETLRLLPPAALEMLLPRSLRRRRVRQRIVWQLDDVQRRNAENLRWSARQNLEDGFRAFEAGLDEQLRLTLSATRAAMELGLRRRAEKSAAAQTDCDMLRVAAERLDQSAKALAALAGP